MQATLNVVIYTQHGRWEEAPRLINGQQRIVRVGKSFVDVALYYANICDYVRVLLSIVSIVMILHAPDNRLLIAACIMGNVVLDCIDGPLARTFGQSTIIGVGLDWLADILAQYGIAVWVVVLRNELPAWVVTFTVLFTMVELATALLDFAISAGGTYPSQKTSALPWYLRVEHWLTPNGAFSYVGTTAWLMNTAFPLSYAIGAPFLVSWVMLPLALLYAWHEFAQFVFLLVNWQETTTVMYRGRNPTILEST